MEGRDRAKELGKMEFEDIGNTVGVLLRVCKPIWHSGTVVVLDSVINVSYIDLI